MTPKTITVLLARATPVSKRHVPDLDIRTDSRLMPSDNLDDQAARFVDAIFATLPGGLVDLILIRLLDKVRSTLHVPYPQPEEKTQ